MSSITFEAFPKIPRLNRGMVITEKIDGTNGAVVILPEADINRITHEDGRVEFFDNDARFILARSNDAEGNPVVVAAQSRSKLINTEFDNFGFAGWVQRNADNLAFTLGVGRHFGEWWGAGIQRRYGLTGSDKRFSLFNTNRWHTKEDYPGMPSVDFSSVPGLGVVPLLYSGPFDHTAIKDVILGLKVGGSVAAPEFMEPEGVVVFLPAARSLFKVMVENDDVPKGEVS